MKLKVWLPTEVLLEEEVCRIKAEAENGWFGLLPKHVDFFTALVPGVMTFEPCGKPEEYLAIDRGILVKCGPEVSISTRRVERIWCG
jgi:F-type H+-transporting ATPase subunit epsilon